jgi:hypothetical protein
VPVLSWTDTTGTPITRIDFADTNTGATQSTTVRLRNAGPGGATLQFANMVGLDASQFVLDTTDCASGRQLFEGISCQVIVQFAPGTAGAKTASLQLAANAGTPAALVVSPLLGASGTGIGSSTVGTLQLSTTALQFGDTVVGAAGLPLELRLSNTGSQNLNVQALDVTGPFTVQGKTCASVPFVLLPGNECTVIVAFQPQAEGALAGTLQVMTSASATATEVALSGRAEPKADLSSGGCSIASGDSAIDPTLWVLVLLAVLVLLRRHRARRAERDRRRDR